MCDTLCPNIRFINYYGKQALLYETNPINYIGNGTYSRVLTLDGEYCNVLRGYRYHKSSCRCYTTCKHLAFVRFRCLELPFYDIQLGRLSVILSIFRMLTEY